MRQLHHAVNDFYVVQSLSNSTMSSISDLDRRATLNASGRLGSYFSVSIALTVWRETPSLACATLADGQRGSLKKTLRLANSRDPKALEPHAGDCRD